MPTLQQTLQTKFNWLGLLYPRYAFFLRPLR